MCVSFASFISKYLCMIIIRNDERCDRTYWGRTMRGAQNGCNELPARRSNRTSRVGGVCKQIRRDGRCGRVLLVLRGRDSTESVGEGVK